MRYCTPLNEQLYDQLERAFGHITIANEGENPDHVPALRTQDGQSRLRYEPRGGEYYRVNCPFCTDTRQRLWVSHLWGVEDDDGNDNLHLAHCFNHGCVDSRARQRELQIMLLTLVPGLGPRMPRSRRPYEPHLDLPADLKLPDNLVPVNRLPDGHPAKAYLEGRGFDPEGLWRVWEVSHCEYDGNARPPVINRLVLPVYRPRVLQPSGAGSGPARTLVGWQARVVGTPEGDAPKYLSCAGMQKSRLLYGQWQARSSRGPVIVCEGPTDVWRLGPGAVALFGKSLSEFQASLIARNFPGRPVVVLLDSDAQEEAEAARNEIRLWVSRKEESRPVVVAKLPEGGKDPADFPKEVVMGCVARALGGTPKLLGLG